MAAATSKLERVDSVLPASPVPREVRLGFCVADDITELVFKHRPIGIEFGKSAPIAVQSVEDESQAQELGVQSGWTIVLLNGQDLSGQGFRSVLRLLQKTIGELPRQRLRRKTGSKPSSMPEWQLETSPMRAALLEAVRSCSLGALAPVTMNGQREAEPANADGSGILQPSTVIYRCRQNAGLGNCLLMFLAFAQRAESKGFQSILFDGSTTALYGDVSSLFLLPKAQAGGKVMTHRSKELGRCGSFAESRGVHDCLGGLLPEDVAVGRRLAARHLHLHPKVESCLLEAASALRLSEAVGVHIRRTDKGSEAPSNLALTVSAAAKAVCDFARELGCSRVFLASDDATFICQLRAELEAQGLSTERWDSHLSAKAGKPCHFDEEIPGLEKAIDAMADCFLLAQCSGIISTFSSLSVLATLWAKPTAAWRYFPDLLKATVSEGQPQG